MEQEDDGRHEENDTFGLELGDGVALVNIIPLGPLWLTSDGGGSGGLNQSRSLSSCLRNRIRSSSKVGKVCKRRKKELLAYLPRRKYKLDVVGLHANDLCGRAAA